MIDAIFTGLLILSCALTAWAAGYLAFRLFKTSDPR